MEVSASLRPAWLRPKLGDIGRLRRVATRRWGHTLPLIQCERAASSWTQVVTTTVVDSTQMTSSHYRMRITGIHITAQFGLQVWKAAKFGRSTRGWGRQPIQDTKILRVIHGTLHGVSSWHVHMVHCLRKVTACNCFTCWKVGDPAAGCGIVPPAINSFVTLTPSHSWQGILTFLPQLETLKLMHKK